MEGRVSMVVGRIADSGIVAETTKRGLRYPNTMLIRKQMMPAYRSQASTYGHMSFDTSQKAVPTCASSDNQVLLSLPEQLEQLAHRALNSIDPVTTEHNMNNHPK